MTWIGSYELTTDFSTSGGGQCRWAFARRDGKEFFIKEFLSPTFSLPESPGSTATKERKRRHCEIFEWRHEELRRALSQLSGTGGNLVVTRDFFRHGTKYYKTTDKIDVSALSLEDISWIQGDRLFVLAGTVAHSLQILHRHQLVHGDIKPDNVLVKETRPGHYAAKLIDFDDAFYSGYPSSPDELVGFPPYYSPELLLYLQDELSGESLTCASDIFALGVLFIEYFTGRYPAVVDAAGDPVSCAAHVLDGGTVTTGLEAEWSIMRNLISSMLDREPARRPEIGKVFAQLQEIRRLERVSDHDTPPSARQTPPRLRGSLSNVAGKPDTVDHPTRSSTPSGTSSRLSGSLAPKAQEDRHFRREGETGPEEETASGRLRGRLSEDKRSDASLSLTLYNLFPAES
jgi:serine/threonine protein kinase